MELSTRGGEREGGSENCKHRDSIATSYPRGKGRIGQGRDIKHIDGIGVRVVHKGGGEGVRGGKENRKWRGTLSTQIIMLPELSIGKDSDTDHRCRSYPPGREEMRG